MFSLISALAAPETTGTTGSTGSMMTTFVTFGLIIVIFYFLIIRPQRKRDKETKEMLSTIKKGDKVVSIGGIHGTIVAVKETTVVVKVDDTTRIEFSRNAISSVVDRKASGASASSKKKSKKEEQVTAPEKTEAEPVAETTDAETDTKDNK